MEQGWILRNQRGRSMRRVRQSRPPDPSADTMHHKVTSPSTVSPSKCVHTYRGPADVSCSPPSPRPQDASHLLVSGEADLVCPHKVISGEIESHEHGLELHRGVGERCEGEVWGRGVGSVWALRVKRQYRLPLQPRDIDVDGAWTVSERTLAFRDVRLCHKGPHQPSSLKPPSPC